MSRVIPSILPYTLLKDENGSPLLVFLLWRDRRSSASESTHYWSSIVTPITKEDHSPLDAVTRGFSEKTKGEFAPANMVYEDEHQLDAVQRKAPHKQKIEDSRIFLRKKLIQGNGVTLLSIRQYITYVAPVRFIPVATLHSSFGADKGETAWVSAQELFGALYSTTPDHEVAIHAHTYQTANERSKHSSILQLALPFTVTMRTAEARTELAAILKQFNVNVDASIMPDVNPNDKTDESSLASTTSSTTTSQSATAANSTEPDLSSLSLNPSLTTSPSSTSSAPSTAGESPSVNYACRKCRKYLFTDLDLSTHTLPTTNIGRFAGKYIKVAEGGARRQNTECSSYFIERVSTLGDFPESDGPLLCPHCKTRFGHFIWSGAQCSCGEWIVPAFQAVKSKVDERPIQANKVNHIAFQFQRPTITRPPPEPKPTLSSSTVATTNAEASSIEAASVTSTLPTSQ